MMFSFSNSFRLSRLIWIMLIPALVSSCAVLSKEIRQEALPQPPFDELLIGTDTYKGRTVILGGYVVSVENHKDQSQVVAVQVPLGAGQHPKSKDYSKGRLILVSNGFIDPEVFTKDRRITVGGTLIGSSATERHNHPFRYLRIQIKEIHLWTEPDPARQQHFWYDDCYPYPYGWRRWHRRYHPWCW